MPTYHLRVEQSAYAEMEITNYSHFEVEADSLEQAKDKARTMVEDVDWSWDDYRPEESYGQRQEGDTEITEAKDRDLATSNQTRRYGYGELKESRSRPQVPTERTCRFDRIEGYRFRRDCPRQGRLGDPEGASIRDLVHG